MRGRWLVGSWTLAACVVIGAVAYGTADQGGDPTAGDRAYGLAQSVKCPTCRGQSVAESNAVVAEVIRGEIGRRVDLGQSDDQILAYLADRYGEDVLLNPPATGAGSLVWILPIAGGAAAVGGLALAFRRWRAW